MKKVLALALVLSMLVSIFAMSVAAVDNYEPKTINLIANTDGTCSLPEGYVVYLGDTLVFPRDEMFFIGDYKVRINGKTIDESTEVRETAVAVANDMTIEIDGVQIGSGWTSTWPLNNTITQGGDYWFESGSQIVAGKYTFKVLTGHDAAWTEQYWLDPSPVALEVEVIDPKTVDTIVAPPAVDTPAVDTPADPTESTEEPVESTEAPVESTEEPVESTEEPVESTEEPVESTEAPTESEDEPTDVAPANNGWVVWVIVAAAAVAVVVVVIVLTSKKKK